MTETKRGAPDDAPLVPPHPDEAPPPGPARAPVIQPAPNPIGEGEANLRRRADWFRRRVGAPEKKPG